MSRHPDRCALEDCERDKMPGREICSPCARGEMPSTYCFIKGCGDDALSSGLCPKHAAEAVAKLDKIAQGPQLESLNSLFRGGDR